GLGQRQRALSKPPAITSLYPERGRFPTTDLFFRPRRLHTGPAATGKVRADGGSAPSRKRGPRRAERTRARECAVNKRCNGGRRRHQTEQRWRGATGTKRSNGGALGRQAAVGGPSANGTTLARTVSKRRNGETAPSANGHTVDSSRWQTVGRWRAPSAN